MGKKLLFALSMFGLLFIQATRAVESKRIHLRAAAAEPTTAPTTEVPPTSPPESTPTRTSDDYSDEDESEPGEDEDGGMGDEGDWDEDDYDVYLEHLEPSSGSVLGGQEVHVFGYGFPEAPADEDYSNPPLECKFDEIKAKVISWSNQYVLCVSPKHPAGVASVTIIIANKTVDPLAFMYTASPIVEGVDPFEAVFREGEEAKTFTVSGKNFKKGSSLSCRFQPRNRAPVNGTATFKDSSHITCTPVDTILPSEYVYISVSNDGSNWSDTSPDQTRVRITDECAGYSSCEMCVVHQCGYCFHTEECQSGQQDGLAYDVRCRGDWVPPLSPVDSCSNFEAEHPWSGKGAAIGVGLLLGLGLCGGLAFLLLKKARGAADGASAAAEAFGSSGRPTRDQGPEGKPLRQGQWDGWQEDEGDGWTERQTERPSRGGRGRGRA